MASRILASLASLVCLAALASLVAANDQLANDCNRTAMAYNDEVDWQRFAGKWYVQYFSFDPYQAGASDVHLASWAFQVVPAQDPPTDKRGRPFVSFKVVQESFKQTNDFYCTPAGTFLGEEVEGKLSFSYQAVSQPDPLRYFVHFRNYYVLETDYDKNAVMLLEQVPDGRPDMALNMIQVWTRESNLGYYPSYQMWQSAMKDFCDGSMADLYFSGFYQYVPNNYYGRC